MKNQMTCIVCPIGCSLTVEGDRDNLKISGNKCNRGIEYAKNELIAPKRMVTSTVRVFGGRLLSVKTSAPIQKELIFECLKQIKLVTVEPPIRIGDIIIENVLNSGVDIVATKNIEKE